MTPPDKHIYPVFDRLMQRADKEQLLGQQAGVFWFTGLSGSGKTTVAQEVEKRLHHRGLLVQVLDGDNVRTGLCNNLGFSPEDRTENIRRIAEVSKLALHSGLITIGCFVSPTLAIRAMAREIIGEGNFHEVFIDTPLAVCEARDPKGLYQKARAGEIPNFTGISAPFEAPVNPELHVQTEQRSVADVAEEVVTYILAQTRASKA